MKVPFLVPFKWSARRTWTARRWPFMWTRSTASHATARNMGLKATASGAEPALWAWTAEKDLESSLNREGGRSSSCYFNSRDQSEPRRGRRPAFSSFKQPPRPWLSSVLSLFLQTDKLLTVRQITPTPQSSPRGLKAQTFVQDARRRCTRRRSVSELERY